MLARLIRSTRPRLNRVQRFFSRLVWGTWMAYFLFFELTGLLKYAPHRTYSETIWDTEDEFPALRPGIEDFLIGLALHLRYRATLESSIELGVSLRPAIDYAAKRSLFSGGKRNTAPRSS